ncbi:tryptophan dimethylallyltransferase family protein [Streptomyces sp. PR69]|uniref:tryptophan dimethylallyltransferase family protein n=1 Tax=Streptomyces sp. PR69 TaxID=2984950 RepID=UPI002264EE74|nr:tryptophan dimethylallyltransferase family protein [Streptomyces sp. PR69]
MESLRTESPVSAGSTFLDYGTAAVADLLDSAGMDAGQGAAVLRRMLSPWGLRQIGQRPDWNSDVCADGSPIEFSAAFSDRCAQIRVLVEAVPDELTTLAAQKSAVELTRTLIEEFGAARRRLAAVSDLFLPHQDPAGFAMMHAAIFTPTGGPEFKVYLNPNANSRMTGPQRVREALERLGFGKAWDAVTDYARRGFDLDRIVYFGLDLSDGPESRVKVYFRHYDIAPADLDACMEISASHEPGLLEKFCHTLTGRAGAIRDQPLVSNLTFTDAGGCAPVSATVYVPLWLYVDSDEEARDRISSVMTDVGLPSDRYVSLLNQMARRPLSDGRGIHTYASVRVQQGRPRMTTYWSSELYDRHPPARYQRG